ncbi:uncharacterized protein [Drosophila pseudoobscura]|nr:uncharacterized protein LOC6903595 isoform X2 [Drosophila pseudoobscura]XP_033235799.1 uncharacterized protein LOC6903595 isoform X2 [Drosophila pseudoobscura]
MLMPVLEYSYNRHIAKIPNCKMRRTTTLRVASMRMGLLFLQLLLVPLLHCQAVDPAASGGAGAIAGGTVAGGGVGAGAGAPGGAAGSNSLNGGPAGGTLSANLTELGSPDATELVRQFVRHQIQRTAGGPSQHWSSANSWRDADVRDWDCISLKK